MTMKATGGFPEDLEAEATFAFSHAEVLCEADHCCRDYHRMWSMVRLIDVGGGPPRGGAFFTAALLDCAAPSGKARILVAGAADTGVPVLVMNAARDAGLTPEIVVIDRCRTPLAQIDRLAARRGYPMTTRRTMLPDLAIDGMDAVITHNVMRFPDVGARLDVCRALAGALRPGGKLLSIETLETAGVERGKHDVARRNAAFVAKLESTDLPSERKAELAEAAQSFWRRKKRGTIYPETDFRRDLEAAGFAIRSVEHRADTRATSPRIGDGAAAAPRLYSHLVAERVA